MRPHNPARDDARDADQTERTGPAGQRVQPGTDTDPHPPAGGLNPELGDLDAAADPGHAPDEDDDGLPGKAGGGLVGG